MMEVPTSDHVKIQGSPDNKFNMDLIVYVTTLAKRANSICKHTDRL